MNTSPLAFPALVFRDITFDVVDRFGQPWLRYPQIAEALGYAQSRRIIDLYNRNAAEFGDSMTALVDVETPGGRQQVRIFSLRGAHLLGMFARTPRAAEFRHWVLNVLEGIAGPASDSAPAAAPVVLSLPGPGRYLVAIDAVDPAPQIQNVNDYALVHADHVRAVQRDLKTLRRALTDMSRRLTLLQGEADPAIVAQPLSITLETPRKQPAPLPPAGDATETDEEEH